MALALTLFIVLVVYHFSKIRVIEILVRATENYAIQNVEVFDLQFELDVLTEREVFRKGDVFVVMEWIS